MKKYILRKRANNNKYLYVKSLLGFGIPELTFNISEAMVIDEDVLDSVQEKISFKFKPLEVWEDFL